MSLYRYGPDVRQSFRSDVPPLEQEQPLPRHVDADKLPTCFAQLVQGVLQRSKRPVCTPLSGTISCVPAGRRSVSSMVNARYSHWWDSAPPFASRGYAARCFLNRPVPWPGGWCRPRTRVARNRSSRHKSEAPASLRHILLLSTSDRLPDPTRCCVVGGRDATHVVRPTCRSADPDAVHLQALPRGTAASDLRRAASRTPCSHTDGVGPYRCASLGQR